MKKLKMLASILLVLVLCLGFCMPTFADSTTYSITIEKAKDGHQYYAYQILSADYLLKDGAHMLSNIDWGEYITTTTGGNLVKELKNKSSDGSKFKTLADNATAERVAEVLQEISDNSQEIAEFSKIVGDFLLGLETTTGELSSQDTDTYAAGKYVISGLTPGYYLVVDREKSTGSVEQGDTLSRYMIRVVGDATVDVKSIEPYLHKTVTTKNIKKADGTNDNIRNTATTNENVGFKLESKVPDMTGYTDFKYIITDKLAKGFEFNETTLTIKVGNTPYTPEKITTDVETYTPADNNFVVVYNYEKNETTGTEVKIAFKNMTKLTKDAAIEITYNAQLTKDANDGNLTTNANINTAQLKYSSDPNFAGDSNTKTTLEETTYTYSVALNLTKVSNTEKETIEGKEEPLQLNGAKFLVRNSDNVVVGMIVSVKGSEQSITGCTGNDTDGYIANTDKVTLSAGTYRLEEIETPAGYNHLKGQIEVTINVSETGTNEIVFGDPVIATETGDQATGSLKTNSDSKQYIHLQVGNSTGFVLPSTGGIGTVIFTVVGLLVMGTVAVVAIKTNKKD